MTRLRGITWEHPRGIDSLRAVTREFERVTAGVTVGWDTRPLHSFEDTPLGELAREYDIIAMDHPFVGDAVSEGVLVPLDGLLSPEVLDARARDTVGWSHRSYNWQGHQWALAYDAACMVSAFREDLIEGDLPSSWSEVFAFAERVGQDGLLMAANPTHLWGTVLSLCEALSPQDSRDDAGRPQWWRGGAPDEGTFAQAYEMTRRLLELCAPESFVTDPIDALRRLSEGEAVGVPLVFQYVSYARTPQQAHPVSFRPAPSWHGKVTGTLTGGVGLAISALRGDSALAADFIAFATEDSMQREVVVGAGGQPARLSAWRDEAVNACTNDFFSATLPTMDRSFLRPRTPGYPQFQVRAASTVHRAMRDGVPGQIVAAAVAALWGDRRDG